MQKIYLAAPYSSPHADIRESRVAEASRVAALLMMQGHVVFSPITHGHQVANYLHHDFLLDHEFWMRQCLPMLEACDWLVICPLDGWRTSRGVEAERSHARLQRIPEFIWQETRPTIDLLDDEEVTICEYQLLKGASA